MIGVFDSGEGGLSVLREIVKVLPEEKYIYYSDNANVPYGEKTAGFIIGRADAITEELVAKGADIVVVACNTATAAAISHLRAKWSDAENPKVRERVLQATGGRRDHVMFIGMEPAVKPAALGTKSGVIGVLATAGTLKGSKYLTTKGKVDSKVKVAEHVGKGFVELVEAGEMEGQHAEDIVRASLQPLLDEGADVIVLGCTHYPFLADTIQKVAGPDVRLIDPAPAVAKQLIKVMQADGLLPECCERLDRQDYPDAGWSSDMDISAPTDADASANETSCAKANFADKADATEATNAPANATVTATGGKITLSPNVILLASGDMAPLLRIWNIVLKDLKD